MSLSSTLGLPRGICCYSRGAQGSSQARGCNMEEGSQTCDGVHAGTSLLTALRRMLRLKALTTCVSTPK
jgi:hypothetical protein